MKTESDFIPSGGITSPGGFFAGAVHTGIKYPDTKRLDLGILFSRVPCAAAAVFTNNKVKAAPVLLDIQRLKKGKISAVVMNSGSANACTGKQGMANAIEMTELAARNAGQGRRLYYRGDVEGSGDDSSQHGYDALLPDYRC
jgi:glutamate N-acetyltransferase/amino-acid N-acetyltransferase